MLTLTPGEALATFNGFSLAAQIQNGILYWIPPLLFFTSLTMAGLSFRNGNGEGARHLTRLAVAVLVMAFVWPGSVIGVPGKAVDPNDFRSAAAISSGAPIQSAADMPATARVLRAPPEIGLFPYTVVQFLSEAWLNIAIAMRSKALTPFSGTQPLAWLINQGLSTANVAAIRDWTGKCVVPAWEKVLSSPGVDTSFVSMLPFDSSPTATAMGGIQVMAGRGYGLFGRLSPFVGGRQSCATYGSRIVSDIEGELTGTLTASGRPITELWSQEHGVSATEAAQYAIMKEVYRAAQIAPPSSLVGTFAVGTGFKVLGDSLGGALRGAKKGLAHGALIGAGGAAAGGQLSNIGDAITQWVGPALFVSAFATDLLAMAQTVMLALMPFLFCYVLVPGRQAILMPVISYFVVLSLLYSSPVWWATIELMSASSDQLNTGLLSGPMAWGKAKLAPLIYQTVGIGVVIMALATVTSLAAGVSGTAIIRSLRRP